jgi:hypothetical protein
VTFRLAYEEITLAHGGNTVRLRPTLRAATTLERSHDGLANLFGRVDEFHLGTVREIVLASATIRLEAETFLQSFDGKPLLAMIAATRAPIADLCRGFIPASDAAPDNKPASGKPMAWPAFYRELYRSATGWLGWTPEAAWNATPTEINEAYAGHLAMLKAIHGSADEPEKQADPDQAARNSEAGLDPEFDRAGLRALKAKFGRKPS